MKNKLPVLIHLTDAEQKILLNTHAAHHRSMGFTEREKYTLENIVNVKRGKNCLRVYYKNGDWWHYTPSGKWY